MENSELIINKLNELMSKVDNQVQSKSALSCEEACKYLGVSKSYLYKLTHTSRIVCYKPTGKLLFFRKEDLDTWLLQNKQSSVNQIEQSANQFSFKKKIL